MRVLVELWPRVLPGKKPVYVRPEVAARLRRAEARLGRPIYPTGSMSGGRTRAQQQALYDAYMAGKGPVASHPDTGPRPHMKFGAFDVSPESLAAGAREAMQAVGFEFTESSELWHSEEPGCRAWPVVTDPYTLTAKENPVSMIKKTERGVEWCLFAPLMSGPLGGTPDQLGYRVTGNESTARIWCDMYGIAFDAVPEYKLEPYRRAQAEARAITGDILARIPASSANFKPVLDAIAQVPTAEENGRAARAAIVK